MQSSAHNPVLETPFPDRFGPCRILRRLGRGGMGAVYLAELVEARPFAAVGARVALKLLRRDLLTDPLALRRFERELELGRAIEHPGVVRTLGAERASNGTVGLLLEYVEGRTLAELIALLGSLPEPLVRDVGAKVAGALAAIHAAGVVHRDVKPSNVMVTTRHEVKLLDLGVAGLLESGSGSLTGTSFVGSLSYAAPEQLGGAPAAAAADLHALGILLYEATTGQHPFGAGELGALVRRIVELVPPRVTRAVPFVTPFLAEAIARLLEKDARRRFGSAADVVEVLTIGEASSWWRERREREAGVEFSLGGPGGGGRPMVGHEEALRSLFAMADDALEGRGGIAIVEGDPGAGKTRLVAELAHRLSRGSKAPVLLWGGNEPDLGSGARGAVQQSLVRHFFEQPDDDRLRAALGSLPALEAALQAFVAGDPSAVVEAGDARELVRAAVCALARTLASERGVVWLLEDLDAASPFERGLTLGLARIAAAERLLLVITTSPGAEPLTLFELERLASARNVSLHRLNAKEVIALLAAELGSEDLATELAPELSRRSGGNPFDLLELVRDLADRGVLVRRPDGGMVRGARLEHAGPTSGREAMARRLAALADADRRLLEAAAVAGQPFLPERLARMLERPHLEVLQQLADIERRTRLVRAAGASFEFGHRHLFEALRAEAPVERLAALHGRCFALLVEEQEALGREPAAVPGQIALLLVRHALESDEPQAATPWIESSLRHLGVLYQHEDVLELADRVLVRLRDHLDPRLLSRIHLVRAGSLDRRGDRAGQQRAIEASLAAAEAAGDELLRCRAWLGMSHHRTELAEYARAEDAARQALRLAEQAADAPARVAALGALAVALLNLGQGPEALAILERQAREFPALDDRAQARARLDAAATLAATGRLSEAHRAYHDALERMLRLEDRDGAALAHLNVGLLDLYAGRFEEARAHQELALAGYRECGNRRGEALSTANLALLARDRGDYGTAGRLLLATRAIFRELGDRRAEGICLGHLGVIALEEGRLDDAEGLLVTARSLALSTGLVDAAAHARLKLGDLARARDDHGAARLAYEEALIAARKESAHGVAAEAALALGRLRLEAGDRAGAVVVLREADQLCRAHGLAEPGPLPAAYLELAGERAEVPAGIASEVEAASSERMAVAIRAEYHLVRHEAGAAGDHLEAARTLLARMSEHLDGSALAAFWRNAPGARRFRALANAASR